MDETNKFATPGQQNTADSSSATTTAKKIMDQGAEAYGKAEQAVCDAYDKTTHKVKETYDKAKTYSDENPGKTILIALGIGIGIGILLSAGTSHRSSRTSRIAHPIVNALSEVAHEFFS